MRRFSAPIAVDDDVAKADYLSHRSCEVCGQPSGARQQIEELRVGPRLAETLIGRDVRRHVERGLDRDLQRMCEEAFFADVSADRLGTSQLAHLAHAGLDESELLLDEIQIGHYTRAPADRRYSLR